MKIEIDGLKVYDPRIEKYVVSDNPALIMADLIVRGCLKTSLEIDELFWSQIAELADFCDKKQSD